MFDKINEFKDTLKTLKEFEKKLTNVDLSDPTELLDKLGVDINEIENNFNEQFDNQKLTLKYVLDSDNKEPEYAYKTDSGFDLRSNVYAVLPPFGRALIPTGLYLDVPEKCEVQVRPKSGLAIKKGLSVVNTPGTVDQGYTGEIQVILINLSNETHTIEVGDKIAQAVLCPVVSGKYVDLVQINEVTNKDRGENGFGSTGN